LVLDFVLKQLSSFGWRYEGNIDAVTFTLDQKKLGYDEKVFKEGAEA